jgi:hypothetical protein
MLSIYADNVVLSCLLLTPLTDWLSHPYFTIQLNCWRKVRIIRYEKNNSGTETEITKIISFNAFF